MTNASDIFLSTQHEFRSLTASHQSVNSVLTSPVCVCRSAGVRGHDGGGPGVGGSVR